MGSSFGQTVALLLQSVQGSSSAAVAPRLAAEEQAAGSSAAQVAAPKRVRWAEGADLEQVLVFQVSAGPQPCMILFIIIIIYNSNIYLFCLQYY